MDKYVRPVSISIFNLFLAIITEHILLTVQKGKSPPFSPPWTKEQILLYQALPRLALCLKIAQKVSSVQGYIKLQKIPMDKQKLWKVLKVTFYSNFQTTWAFSFPILSLLFFTRTLTLLWWREKRESLQSRLHITAPFTFPYIFHVSSITNDLKGLTSLENRQAVPNCHPRSDECIIFRIFCYSTFRYCY